MEINSEYLLTFLLNASWQITVVVALAALASGLLRNGPARYRQLIWMAALLASLMVPIYSTTKPAVTASLPVNAPVPVTLDDGFASTLSAGPMASATAGAPPVVHFSASASVIVTAVYCLCSYPARSDSRGHGRKHCPSELRPKRASLRQL